MDSQSDFLACLENVFEDDEAAALEGEVSLHEAEGAMVSFKKGKAPGCDGLPVELYCSFWQLIGQDLVGVYNETLAAGLLPASEHRTCLPSVLERGQDRFGKLETYYSAYY